MQDNAKKILLGEEVDDIMSVCFKFILAYEKGEWDKLFEYSEKYPINIEKVSEAYHEAFIWTNNNELA